MHCWHVCMFQCCHITSAIVPILSHAGSFLWILLANTTAKVWCTTWNMQLRIVCTISVYICQISTLYQCMCQHTVSVYVSAHYISVCVSSLYISVCVSTLYQYVLCQHTVSVHISACCPGSKTDSAVLYIDMCVVTRCSRGQRQQTQHPWHSNHP